jgi:hypothetical protein
MILAALLLAGVILLLFADAKAAPHGNEITIDYPNMIDSGGRLHRVQLVFRPYASVIDALMLGLNR